MSPAFDCLMAATITSASLERSERRLNFSIVSMVTWELVGIVGGCWSVGVGGVTVWVP